MPNPDTAVTQKDFQSLVKEIRKTNAKLDNMSSSSIVDKVVAPIKKQFGGIKDSIQRPFKSAKGVITKPFEVVSSTIESVGEAARKPFESFKNVSQGFKNLFKKDESQLQTELLEEIRDSIQAQFIQNQSFIKLLKGNDLRDAELTKERRQLFESINKKLDRKGSEAFGGLQREKARGKLGIPSSLSERIIKPIIGIGTTLFAFSKRFRGLIFKEAVNFKNFAKNTITSAKNVLLRSPGKLGEAASVLSTKGEGVVKSLKTKVKDVKIGQKKLPFPSALKETVSGAKKSVTSKLGLDKPKQQALPLSRPSTGSGFLSRLNPMKRIKEAAQPIVRKIPQVLKRIPIVGSVVESILLNSSIKSILDDPETPAAEKKKLVGTEFIKALTGPAGAAIAIGAVGAITGGTGFLASAVTGAGGYAVGKFIGGILAKGLPAESIGGSIIDTFYKKEAAIGGMSTGPAVDIKTKAQEAAKGSTDSVVSMPQAKNTSSAISSNAQNLQRQVESTIDKPQNETGANMLIETNQIANTKAALEAESKESGDVNTNVVDNSTGPSNTTVINEAPKHIDRTMQVFGAIPAY